MKNSNYSIFGLLFLLTFCSTSNLSYNDALEKNEQRLDTQEEISDAHFLVEAANYHLALQSLAKAAVDSGYAKIVNDFAREVLTAQNKLGADLKEVAKQKKVKLPSQMSIRLQDIVEEVKHSSRRNFDRSFLYALENIHEEALGDFEHEALNAHAAEVRSFAAAKLDMIRKHEKKADQLQDQLL